MSGDPVTQLVKKLAGAKLPEPASLATQLATTLNKTSENAYWTVYGFKLAEGPFGRGDLRLSQDGTKALLNLETRAAPSISERDLSLGQWGEVRGIVPNPRIPPEGADTYIYEVESVRVSLQFAHQSRLLNIVTLEWGAALGAGA
jgi:hypothetical protein